MRFLFFLMIVLLSGCSLYKSSGRKALESGAYSYAGVAAFENLQGCGSLDLSNDWQNTGTADGLTLWLRDLPHGEVPGSELQVVDSPGDRGCLFTFKNDLERQERLPSAIEMTLLHLSLGRFAFEH